MALFYLCTEPIDLHHGAIPPSGRPVPDRCLFCHKRAPVVAGIYMLEQGGGHYHYAICRRCLNSDIRTMCVRAEQIIDGSMVH